VSVHNELSPGGFVGKTIFVSGGVFLGVKQASLGPIEIMLPVFVVLQVSLDQRLA
jgi:hypothetical protein